MVYDISNSKNGDIRNILVLGPNLSQSYPLYNGAVDSVDCCMNGGDHILAADQFLVSPRIVSTSPFSAIYDRWECMNANGRQDGDVS